MMMAMLTKSTPLVAYVECSNTIIQNCYMWEEERRNNSICFRQKSVIDPQVISLRKLRHKNDEHKFIRITKTIYRIKLFILSQRKCTSNRKIHIN